MGVAIHAVVCCASSRWIYKNF